MSQLTLLFVVLLAAIITTPLAARIGVPQPVLMTAFGLVLAVLPFVPRISLDPDLILPLVLPPLIYASAQRSTASYFRANLRTILLLAVALVLVTTAAVAWACTWLIPALPLGAAIALGALISPPDPIAAAAVAGSVGLPRRLLSSLETEGLFNDVTALVVSAWASTRWSPAGFPPCTRSDSPGQDEQDAAERQLWARVGKAGARRLKELAETEELSEELVDRLKQRQLDRLARYRPDLYDEEQRLEMKQRMKRAGELMRVEQELIAAGRHEMQVARIEPGADPVIVDRVIHRLDIRTGRSRPPEPPNDGQPQNR